MKLKIKQTVALIKDSKRENGHAKIMVDKSSIIPEKILKHLGVGRRSLDMKAHITITCNKIKRITGYHKSLLSNIEGLKYLQAK